ncbi:MAG: SURF1 family protein [Acidimicrobiales bacterium]
MPEAVNLSPQRTRPSYRFLYTPRWLAGHVLAVLALAVMVAACFWQLSRLADKQATNRLYAAHSAQPVEAVTDVAGPDATVAQVEGLRFRLLSAQGTYLREEEVFIRSRSLNGNPGAWVLTPLRLSAQPDTVVVINRGWIPASDTTPELPAGAEAPAGTVTVAGLALATETRGALGSVDHSGTELDVLARVDLPRLSEQLEEAMYPFYLQLQQQDPPLPDGFPAPVPPPPPDEGPHRGYAGQWAIFAVLWVIGYPLLVRRSARRRVLPDLAARN